MINQKELQPYLDEVNENVNDFTSITINVVHEQSADLDELMQDLKFAVTQPDAISTDALERYYIELSNLIYFMAERIEKLNVFKEMSKATAKEAYNKAYLKYSSEKDEKGKSLRTVNENSSLADRDSQYEATVNTIYANAYDSLSMKLDMAQEMVSTLKHILKRTTNEEYYNFQLSNMGNRDTNKDRLEGAF